MKMNAELAVITAHEIERELFYIEDDLREKREYASREFLVKRIHDLRENYQILAELFGVGIISDVFDYGTPD